MKFLAKARKVGACAWSRCERPGVLVYQGDRYRYRVCCKGHAEEAERQIAKIPVDYRKKVWGERAT